MLFCYATPEKRDYYPAYHPRNPLNYLRKRLLILGKEWVLTQKRRYPVLPLKKLKQAISQEIGDLFPLQSPSYTFQITRQTESFLEVTLFAWEKTLEDELRRDFPFTHLIPEELFYTAKEPTLFILKRGEKFLIIATSHHLFLNSLFLQKEPAYEDISLFLKSLGEPTFKRVYAIGLSEDLILKILPDAYKPLLVVKKTPFELLSEILPNLSLKNFRSMPRFEIDLSYFLLQSSRFFIMVIIALQMNLLFSYWEYKKAISSLKEKNKTLEIEIRKYIAPITSKKSEEGSKDEERLKALEELKEELKGLEVKGTPHPLLPLNELSRLLPDGSRLERFSLREKNLELFLEAKDIFEVLTLMRKNPFFSEFKLSGTPLYDSRKQIYRFRLEVKLK